MSELLILNVVTQLNLQANLWEKCFIYTAIQTSVENGTCILIISFNWSDLCINPVKRTICSFITETMKAIFSKCELNITLVYNLPCLLNRIARQNFFFERKNESDMILCQSRETEEHILPCEKVLQSLAICPYSWHL